MLQTDFCEAFLVPLDFILSKFLVPGHLIGRGGWRFGSLGALHHFLDAFDRFVADCTVFFPNDLYVACLPLQDRQLEQRLSLHVDFHGAIVVVIRIDELDSLGLLLLPLPPVGFTRLLSVEPDVVRITAVTLEIPIRIHVSASTFLCHVVQPETRATLGEVSAIVARVARFLATQHRIDEVCDFDTPSVGLGSLAR